MYKKNIYIVFLSFFFLGCLSKKSNTKINKTEHRIPMKKLFGLSDMSIDSVDAYLESMGFDKKTKFPVEGYDCTIWGLIYPFTKNANPIMARLEFYTPIKSGAKSVSYLTTDQDYYFNCLNEIENMGFNKEKESFSSKGDISKVYKSEKDGLIIYFSTESKDTLGHRIYAYSITPLKIEKDENY
jgi:hypothetical protein